jgi:demethylmenaquinone methyltransferase/2-methoxy-6-polyprenyl-1,4-benzoquinol methylase
MGQYEYLCAMISRYEHDPIVPYEGSAQSKKEQVAGMFNGIAGKYDFLNRFLSAGLDVRWRKKALAELKPLDAGQLLDVATGTADVALMAARMFPHINIHGVDISEGMLSVGHHKIATLKLENRVQLSVADSEALPFSNDSFDAVTVAFGVRNFQHLEKGLSEIYRVLKPEGKLVVLEFSKPSNPLVKIPYQVYMKYLTPFFGGLFSKDKKAYAYLDASIRKFPEGKHFCNVLDKTGFRLTRQKKRSFGVCSVYVGVK